MSARALVECVLEDARSRAIFDVELSSWSFNVDAHDTFRALAAINDFLAAWNEKPKPFVWTATVESIVGKLARCRQTLEQIQPGCTVPRTRKPKTS